MNKTYDVVGVGLCTLDHLLVVNEFPAVDTKKEAEAYVVDGGGPAATALVTLARLGATTALMGTLGDDERGRRIMAGLVAEGVDVSHLRIRSDSESQVSMIVVDEATGTRTIFYTNGSPLAPDEVDPQVIGSARMLHIDGHQMTAALEAACHAREGGDTLVLVDAGSMRPGFETLLPLSDYFVASQLFARQYTGLDEIEQAAEILAADCRGVVVITAGARGGYCLTADEAFWYPAFEVEVADTTGAGDVFHGAFAFGVLQGWDMERTTTFASAVSAINCQTVGGRAGLPTYAEVVGFMANRSYA